MNESDDLLKWLGSKAEQKVLLVSARDRKDFNKAFRSIPKYCNFPIEGSMFERPTSVEIPGRQMHFFVISLNGNLKEWEAGVIAMCRADRREIAWVQDGVLIRFASGEEIKVEDILIHPD